ncbi:MAG: T9SS type A sorting domain-containing protein [Putridiphycobacter sp.]|nr:T9SS type A sorting domain-containing protein [Putridiphycobacter sp.]
MLKGTILVNLICFCGSLMAQPVLNKRTDLNVSAKIFADVIATDSCYFVAGTNAGSQALQEGLFVRFNLDGTVANTSSYGNDTSHIVFWESPTLIQTNDNNFALTFAVDPISGPRHFGFIKLKPNGDTLIFKTYLDIYDETLDDVVFQPGGFLQDSVDSCYYGTINISKELTALSGVALIKLDPLGNLLWYKKFYGSFSSTYFGHNSQSLIKTHDNKLIIGGSRYKNGLGTSTIRSNIKFTITDLAGNLLQTKVFPDDILAYGCHGLMETIEGGYIFTGRNGSFFQNGNAMEFVGRVVKLDSNFDEIWRIERGYPAVESFINFENILKISDTAFVAVGTSTDSTSYPIWNHAGWLLKFNLDGDVLWERNYQKVLPNDNTNNFPRHYLYSVDITADSGFVMVGQAINYETTNPEPYGQLGWLVKTDKHGCIVPGCEQFDGLSVSETELPEIGLSVFPNPANNELFVYYANGNHSNLTHAVLFNIQGQQVMQFPITSNNTTYMLDVSSLAKGVYVLQVADSSGLLKSEKVVVE